MRHLQGSRPLELGKSRRAIRWLPSVVTVFLILLVVCSASEARGANALDLAARKGAPVPDNPDAVPGEILVKFKPGRARAAMDNVFAARNIRATRSRRFKKIGWHLVKTPGGKNLKDAVMAYRQDPDVLYAEPNYRLHIDADSQRIPNDTLFDDLWAMHNTGQLEGTVDADIDAPEAWYAVTASTVIVAVLDTGIDYNHPDLTANMWTNPG